MSMKYVDADGHIMENERELNEFFEDPYQNTRYLSLQQMLPRLDGFHTPRIETLKGTTFDRTVGPEKWLEFLRRRRSSTPSSFPRPGWPMDR